MKAARGFGVITSNIGGCNGYEESLKFLIINDRKVSRRKGREELGIRVQISGTSDTTADAAIERVMLSDAIRSGNMEEELKDLECPEQYRREVEVIQEMRDDYLLIRSQIKTLPWSEYKVLNSYLNGAHDLLKHMDEIVIRGRGDLPTNMPEASFLSGKIP